MQSLAELWPGGNATHVELCLSLECARSLMAWHGQAQGSAGVALLWTIDLQALSSWASNSICSS